MSIKKASEVRTWRDTPVGARFFLAQEIEARLREMALPEVKGQVPAPEWIGLILLQLHAMLHSAEPSDVRKIKQVFRID